jgi:iron complex outermembrane receptor protein
MIMNRRSSKPGVHFTVCASAIAAVLAQPALAQSAAAPNTDAERSPIEDIVVTARRREEALQSVPVAVTAVSGLQLERQSIRSLIELGSAVPSLQTRGATSSGSTVNFVLRGQTAGENIPTVDQAVGIYADEVYIARQRGVNGAFFDIERVEVVKGPQGTLYGRNTTGGAINITSRQPDFDGVHGYIDADVGAYDLRTGRVAVNVPLVADKLSARVGYQIIRRDGFGKSEVTGQQLGGYRNQWIFRGLLRYEPTTNFRADFKYERYHQRETGNLVTPYAVFSGTQRGITQAATELFAAPGSPAGCAARFPTGASCITQGQYDAARSILSGYAQRVRDGDIYTSFAQVRQRDDADSTLYSMALAWELADGVELKSITGHRSLELNQIYDLDGTPFSILEVGAGTGGFAIANGLPGGLSSNFSVEKPPEHKSKFFSQEFNLSGSAIGDRLEWLVGAYYSRERGSFIEHSRAFPSIAPSISINNADRILNESWSIYSQNDLKLTEALSITLGGRYTEETKELQAISSSFNPQTGLHSCATGVVAAPNASPEGCRVRNQDTFTGVSYLASLNWKVSRDALLYLKTSRSFRGGAFQLRSPALPPAGPETANDLEFGLKSDWLDRRLRFNLAAYRTDYKNKQESIQVPTASGTTTILQNAADARLKGIEVEVIAVPVQGLTLTGAYTYFEGKYKNYLNALQSAGRPPIDASGEAFPNPKHMYSITAQYVVPVGPGEFSATGTWSYTGHANPSGRAINPFLSPGDIDYLQPSVNATYQNGRNDLGLMNLNVSYALPDMGLSVGLFVTNLFDKKYLAPAVDGTSAGGIQSVIVGAPRMWGLTIRKKFGDE